MLGQVQQLKVTAEEHLTQIGGYYRPEEEVIVASQGSLIMIIIVLQSMTHREELLPLRLIL